MEEEKEISQNIIETLSQIDAKGYSKYNSEFSFLKEFNLMIAIESHDLYKHFDWKFHEILKELGPDHELSKLFKQLMTAIADAGSVLSMRQYDRNQPDDKKYSVKMLKKYSHNIMSVLNDNQLILSTESDLIVKEEVGNKAFKLWEMTKESLPVPPAFFLTFAACRMMQVTGKVLPIVEQLMYYFKGESVAIRSSGIESMPGMLDTFYIKDTSNFEEVSATIMKVIDSWNNEKAVKYRKICKLPDLLQICVIIQKLVEADKPNGFSGSAYSRNPIDGTDELNGEVLHETFGANLASGKVTPKKLNTIPVAMFDELSQYVKVLENKYRQTQYVEFASDGEKLYMLQSREAKISDVARGRVSIDFFKKGWIDSVRLTRIYEDLKYSRNFDLKKSVVKGAKPIAKGIASSYGQVTGRIQLNQGYSSSSEKYIWFVNITTTDDLEKIEEMDGIVTTRGGYTSHPAEVSRLLKKPAIVSAKPLQIFKNRVKIGDKTYNEGSIVTIIGETGEIYEGEVEIETEFILENEFKEALKS